MRRLARLGRAFLFLLLSLSPVAAQETRVRADTEMGFDETGPCNELDVMATHSLTVVELNTTFDKNYPLNVGGQLRTCGGFISVLLKDCEASLPGPQSKGRVITCSTLHHRAGCNKEYIAKTSGSIGNAFIEVHGDSHNTGCDSQPCLIALQGPPTAPPLKLAQNERSQSLSNLFCLP